MAIKTRQPKDLGIDDFITFVRRLLIWIATQVGDPDYRAVLVDGLEAKLDALVAKLAEYRQLQIHVPEINDLYTTAADTLHDGLEVLKGILPSFFDDPDVLGFFGLAKPIPTDLDELFTLGGVCFGKWDEVAGEPEYSDVETDFENVRVMFDDFVSKRDEYELKYQELQDAQNEMVALREEIEEQERNIFQYYRSKHPDYKAEWWTNTPWGTSGGGEEPSVEYPVFPEPPDIFTAEDNGGGMTEVVYGYVDGSTHGLLERRKVGSAEPWIEVSDHLPMDKDNMLPYRELHVPPGEWEYRFTPMNGDEHGASVSATVVVAE